MFILQVNPLHLSATNQPEALVAVARAENIDHLSAFVQNCLSFAEDGVTIKHYESTTPMPDGSNDAVCIKMFRPGSPLENYTAPMDRDMLIVDLGTLTGRIDDLTRELVDRVTSDWQQILTGVVDINSVEVARGLSASDL